MELFISIYIYQEGREEKLQDLVSSFSHDHGSNTI